MLTYKTSLSHKWYKEWDLDITPHPAKLRQNLEYFR